MSYWSKNRLQSYIGELETIRLEFKESKVLLADNGEIDKAKIASKLSIEVSAFANTEGGVILIGMMERDPNKKEKRDKRVVAKAMALDEGVEAIKIGRDQLQRIIEGNVSPYLPGLRVHAVSCEVEPERYWYVIEVPRGETAYQANDFIYYGRSELGAHALRDHDVRVRMVRSQSAAARLDARQTTIHNGFEPSTLGQRARQEGVVPVSGLSYCFELRLTNCGPVSIQDFLLSLEPHGEYSARITKTGSWRFSMENSYQYQEPGCVIPEVKIFPRESIIFPKTNIELWLEYDERHLDPYRALIEWTIYLDNSPPSTGTIDLAEVFVPKER